MVLFRPTLQQQSCIWRYYQPKLKNPIIKPIISLYNRVVSLGLELISAVHEHPKNHNFFHVQVHFLDLSVQLYARNLMLDK